MAFQKEYGESESVVGQVCVHLRTKGMYVSGKVHPTSEESGQHCWCNLTQHVRGPDNEMVNRHACAHGRDCFRATL
jgi:hypothetical protein